MFEIQTLIDGVWQNVSSDGDQPLKYETREEAETDLEDLLASLDDAGMEFDPDEYRVVEEGADE